MSVKVQIVCSLKPENSEALTRFLHHNLPNVRKFYGCNRVGILFDEARSQMLIDEDWQSKEDHKNYMLHIENKGVLGELVSHLTKPPTVSYYYKSDL
ncbi:putative quinol monooxygenase [Pseudoalteromonas luteoviolacea]|uniref:putative quinol monooxygenase n=1 Tax=Pseudoalteromonas luteoviolacea TaxID=43657 RepID=UPI0011521709|nr:antibiotic biosynthesis monooxygenase [Pseudoalteromonas luteoviolacea]TQF71100.1 antibiotic biosynthesis monooxygenase [Pseudoalteromonas luteoviolacea]